jgi:hypothetical protein
MEAGAYRVWKLVTEAHTRQRSRQLQVPSYKDLRTTQGYFHVRESRLLKAAVRLNRKPE